MIKINLYTIASRSNGNKPEIEEIPLCCEQLQQCYERMVADGNIISVNFGTNSAKTDDTYNQEVNK